MKRLKRFYKKIIHHSDLSHSGPVKAKTSDPSVPVVPLEHSRPPHAPVAGETLPSNSMLLLPHSQLHTEADTNHQPKVSFYQNASNFAVYNPIMGETVHVTQAQTSNVLKEILECAMPGAQYDSSARDSPPRCHPGTRTQILQDVQTRIHAMETRMVWVYGPAGVGKSAIMQTLAEAEASRDTTFTTLFFSRPNERDDPKKTFTTLAYGLAVKNLEYRRYIGEKLADDPTFLAKSLDEQFQHLFITPFLTPLPKNRVNIDSQRWVILIDGLDECSDEGQQRRIMTLIRNIMLHRAVLTPFIWIIASRPEIHLKAEFMRVEEDIDGFWALEVPIDSDQSLRDVELYLHVQFTTMRERCSDSIPPLWPSESDFLTIAEASSGLFIFASTLIAYLLGGDPVFRLNHAISLIRVARAQTVDPQQNPFQMLDLLYTQIMSDIPKEILSTTKLLLGFYLLSVSQRKVPTQRLQWHEESSLLRASNIVGLGQYETYAALRKLHSVLDCPPPHEAAIRPVKFLHASFSDFLLDPSRSQAYFIDFNEETTKIWQYCIKILRQYEVDQSHTYISLSWLPDGVDSAVVQENVWQDAQETWMQILLDSRTWGQRNQLLGDNAALVKTLQGLGPTIFRKIGRRASGVVDFLYWLYNNAAPEVRNNFLHQTFNLYDLDADRLFKSLCAQRWCYCILDSKHLDRFHFSDVNLESMAQFSASEWKQAKSALWNQSSVVGDLLLKENQRTASWVLGFEGTKECIVIGPLFRQNSAGVAYYVLPYIDG